MRDPRDHLTGTSANCRTRNAVHPEFAVTASQRSIMKASAVQRGNRLVIISSAP